MKFIVSMIRRRLTLRDGVRFFSQTISVDAWFVAERIKQELNVPLNGRMEFSTYKPHRYHVVLVKQPDYTERSFWVTYKVRGEELVFCRRGVEMFFNNTPEKLYIRFL